MKIIKRFMVICLCCALLPAASLAGTEDALFEASITLSEGAAPTQFTVPNLITASALWPLDPVLNLEVTPPDAPSYTIVFPSYESSDSLAPLLQFKDMNGDGFLDIEAMYILGASNASCTYFLYDAENGRLYYSPQLGILSNADYDPEQHILLSQTSDGVLRSYYQAFSFIDGQPVALGAASLEVQEDDPGYHIHTNVTTSNGIVLLDNSIPFDGSDSAVYNAQYDAMMQTLLSGNPTAIH